MNERIMQFWVGVMVFSISLIVAILILLLGNKPAMFQKKHVVYIDFADAPRVSSNTPIRKSGILIGRIQKVELQPEGGVRLTAGINDGFDVFENEQCVVRSSLMGDSEVQFFLPPDARGPGRRYPAESVIRGKEASDPLDAVANLQESLSGAIGSVAKASESLGETVTRINSLLEQNESHINSIVRQTDDTLKLVQETVQFTNELMSNPEFRNNMKAEIEQLPQMLADARSTISGLQNTMENFNTTLGKVDTNLDNVAKFTHSLGEDGPNILKGVDRSVDQLEKLMIEMESFGRSINSPNGTLGKLVKDDELYQRLNRTVRNVEEISYRMKPIVNDVRIISDRLARHPGDILRDAVKPGPGTKGLPPANWDPNECAQQPSTWQR